MECLDRGGCVQSDHLSGAQCLCPLRPRHRLISDATWPSMCRAEISMSYVVSRLTSGLSGLMQRHSFPKELAHTERHSQAVLHSGA